MTSIKTRKLGTQAVSLDSYRPHVEEIRGFPADCGAVQASQIGGQNSGHVNPCENSTVSTLYNEYRNPKY